MTTFLRPKQRVIKLSLVPTEYLLWMNEQLDSMINDVRKANQDLQELQNIDEVRQN